MWSGQKHWGCREGSPRESSARWDRRLAETAEEARSARAFGVPTFAFEGRTFWGKDQLVPPRQCVAPWALVFERDFSTGKAGFAARLISVADGGSACFGAGRTVENRDGLGSLLCPGGGSHDSIGRTAQ